MTPYQQAKKLIGPITWKDHISTMKDWLVDPPGDPDDGIPNPSTDIINKAIALAAILQGTSLVPQSITCDANGGIVFHWRHHDGSSECYHVWDDGKIEYMHFDGNCKMTDRKTI